MAEIEIKTAPADFRFPTTNQTRHCFTRYIEYHRCVAAKGEEASECSVISLRNTIIPFAQVNGLRSGMSRGRTGHSQGLSSFGTIIVLLDFCACVCLF